LTHVTELWRDSRTLSDAFKDGFRQPIATSDHGPNEPTEAHQLFRAVGQEVAAQAAIKARLECYAENFALFEKELEGRASDGVERPSRRRFRALDEMAKSLCDFSRNLGVMDSTPGVPNPFADMYRFASTHGEDSLGVPDRPERIIPFCWSAVNMPNCLGFAIILQALLKRLGMRFYLASNLRYRGAWRQKCEAEFAARAFRMVEGDMLNPRLVE
jgi:hypothetical protein